MDTAIFARQSTTGSSKGNTSSDNSEQKKQQAKFFLPAAGMGMSGLGMNSVMFSMNSIKTTLQDAEPIEQLERQSSLQESEAEFTGNVMLQQLRDVLLDQKYILM